MSTYLETVASDFKKYCAALNIMVGYQGALESLGPIPPFPVVVEVDTDYTNALSNRTDWESTSLALKENIVFQTPLLAATKLFPCAFAKHNVWNRLAEPYPGDFAPFPNVVWFGCNVNPSNRIISFIVRASAPQADFPNF